ncbi:MAG: ABC transporter permease [Oscillospiraceae bacterium]|nr:ABC transporter permease [Oscillospiraceae bacterium]
MKALRGIFLTLVFLVLYAPMAVMFLFSFNSIDNKFIFSGFSLRWYQQLFSDYDLMGILKNTLIVSLSAAGIATVLGVIAAYGIFRMKAGKLKSAVNTVTNIPLTNPDIITGVSLMLLFTFVGRLFAVQGDKLGFGTLLIAHITFNLPYVILNVLPRLVQSDRSQYEAALDLGCTPTRAFWKIIFPGIVPGIISGFIMAFTLSLDDFIISIYTRGLYDILPTSLYTMVKRPFTPEYYALYTLIFLGILFLMLAVNILQIRAEKKAKR